MALRPTRIAIVGSGPSGSTFAALAADKGLDVVLFSGGKRPEMVVGESGIPALVPIMRRLGIEEEVAAMAQHKPGATFVWEVGNPIKLSFKTVEGILPTYSYNLPRPQFDMVVENRARRSKTRWIDSEALIEKSPDGAGSEVRLSDATLALVPEWNGEQPDLIVDATGRRRTIARLLQIPATTGPRKDMAYFAHYENWKHDGPPGQIIIGRTALGGWSWQIPLRDCISVGVVMNGDTWRGLGPNPEARLEAAIEADPTLADAGKDRKKISSVPTYTNYQLVSDRAFGPGWVSLGDSFGFVDPMLSPGLWIAMHGGEILADLIPNGAPSPNAWPAILKSYEREMRVMLNSWTELIEKFYDGTMMASYATGKHLEMKYPGKISKIIDRHVSRNFAGMCCGAFTHRTYSRKLLSFLCSHTLHFEPKDYAVA